MLIQCTKKLLDQLKRKPEQAVEEYSLFSWHANILTIDRRKTVVLMNDKNRYVIVLHGLKANNFKQLNDMIIKGVRETFEKEGIKDKVISQFIESSKEIRYTKTKDRTSVARLNKACDNVYFFARFMEDDSIVKAGISRKINRLLVGSGNQDYIRPNQEMYKDLREFTGQDIFSTEAVELTVTLNLRNHKVWRRFIVPLNFTFNEFHKVLQVGFGWQNVHLHEFYIYESRRANGGAVQHPRYSKEAQQPLMNLVADDEALAYGSGDIPMQLETGVQLSDYMPAHMIYVYDFGDDWVHHIELIRTIEDYNRNVPVCIEGEGKTPPEDVGGEGGYDEFLRVMSDETDPEHKHMVNWVSGQGYDDFDIDMVNRRLENSIF